MFRYAKKERVLSNKKMMNVYLNREIFIHFDIFIAWAAANILSNR